MKLRLLALSALLLPPVPIGLEVSHQAISKVIQPKAPVPSKLSEALWKLPPPPVGSQVGGYEVTSGFGPRTSPCPGCSSFHRGIDVGAAVGSPVYAVGLPGEKVKVECEPDDGMGHPYSIQSAPSMPDITIETLHLQQCNPGVYPAGAVHSFSGDAGTGPHYHIQIRKLSNMGDDTNGLFPPPAWAIKAVVSNGKLDLAKLE